VEAVGHPPKLGGRATWSALVRRDEEIETAAGHIRNLGGLHAPLSNFGRAARQSTSALIYLDWRSRHRSCGPSAQFPRSGIAKFAVNIWSPDTNKNTNKTDGCSGLRGIWGAADVLKFRLAANF
jgi:hypothetical protein